MLSHIAVKELKLKDENILIASRTKRCIVFKAATVRMMTDFLIARGQWNDICIVLKEKHLQDVFRQTEILIKKVLKRTVQKEGK